MLEYLEMIRDRRVEINRGVQRLALESSLVRVICLSKITASSISNTCWLLSLAKISPSSVELGVRVSISDEDGEE